MLIGAIAGVLAFASAPVSSVATPLPPTPAPMSDKLTVIWCGAVLGESFDTTRARLGEPSSQTKLTDGEYWVYPVDDGAADCMFRLIQGRVVDIYARSTGVRSEPSMIDPYGIGLGTLVTDLSKKRGYRLTEMQDGSFVYPSASGACWVYGFGRGQKPNNPIVFAIRVFLNPDTFYFDCKSR